MPKELSNEEMMKTLNAMATAMTGLGETVKDLQEHNKGVATTLSSITDKMNEAPPPAGGDDDEDDVDDTNLEQLSRKDLIDVMTKRIVGAVNKNVVDPLKEQLGNLSENVTKQDLKGEIKEVASKHDDFGKYGEAIKELAAEKPNYSVEDLYHLAKANNPDLGKELDEDGKPIDDDKGEKDKGDKTLNFGGMTPTSGSSTETKGDLSVDDAADNAWDDAMLVDVAEG